MHAMAEAKSESLNFQFVFDFRKAVVERRKLHCNSFSSDNLRNFLLHAI